MLDLPNIRSILKPAQHVYFVQPGEVIVCTSEGILQTVLGSCVSVVLWDSISRFGGMNHFVIAGGPKKTDPNPNRYSLPSLESLALKMEKTGSNPVNWKAFIVGGARQIANSTYPVGERNIRSAQKWLSDHKIPVKFQDVGGNQGRKVVFHPQAGTISIYAIHRTIK